MHEILYERYLPIGPQVRIRRTSPAGDLPVTAVLEVERRVKRAIPGGVPPQLLVVSADSEAEVLAFLEPKASHDLEVVEMMREKGLVSA